MPETPSTPRIRTPDRSEAPLTPAERQRLQVLREKNIDGDPMTSAERRELLELERRTRLNAPSQPR